MIAQLLSITAPVFIAAGVGFFWTRSGRRFDTAFVTALVTDVGAPCLVFATIAHLPGEPATLFVVSGAAVAALAACAAAGALVLRLAGLSQRAFLPVLVFGNTENVGLPVSHLAFGDAGLGYAVSIFALTAVIQLTFGLALVSGRLSLSSLARLPILWGLFPALWFLLSRERPLAWLDATTGILGGMTVPLMLVTLGVTLGSLTVATFSRSLLLGLMRLGLGLGAGLLAAAFGLDGPARGVVVLQSAMPVAVFTYLFAERYRTSPGEVAGAVVMSTVMSFAALPLLLWIIL